MSINRPTMQLCLLVSAVSAVASPVSAASFVANNGNFKDVFARVRSGDSIVLNGSFGTTVLANRSFSKAVSIDARNARFTGTLKLRNMRGVAFTGGRFGNGGVWQNGGTIRVEDSSDIRFTEPRLTASGGGKARGLMFRGTSDFSVTGGRFSGFRVATGGSGMRNGSFVDNRITRATSDGINIVNSHFITARGNVCSGNTPSPGAHADCIQLWSLADFPVQSDIQLINNIALGNTQGFTSFDPERGGGLRISMIGNIVNTRQPQGIACYNCVDSIITDNRLTTLPDANFRTLLRVIGGSNNTVARNSIGPGPARRLMALSALPFAAAAVPEPGIWAQCLLGFALLGGALRRRRSGGQMQLQELAHVGQHRRAVAKGF